jgi:hypothetical protein
MNRPDLALWPCSTCGAPGVKNLAAHGYCSEHFADVLRSFDSAVFLAHGIGLQTGVLRPDWGPTFAELTCVACDASWVGQIGEACGWCARNRELIVRYQADITTTPPDVDRDDRNYGRRMRAWAERLARAVDAGVITEADADRAWKRVIVNVAA